MSAFVGKYAGTLSIFLPLSLLAFLEFSHIKSNQIIFSTTSLPYCKLQTSPTDHLYYLVLVSILPKLT